MVSLVFFDCGLCVIKNCATDENLVVKKMGLFAVRAFICLHYQHMILIHV